MKIGDLVQRKGTPEWKAIVTGFNNEHGYEHHVRIVWLDSGESDACSIDLLEGLNESR
mgnify:CR=1 FL=1|jgi:hypothetical protein